MHIYKDLEQGSDEWLEARRGILTASEMSLAITPTGKIANNDKVRQHAYELAAQRITGHVEPAYVSDDMLRGMYDEITARELYQDHTGLKVEEVGFITEGGWGFDLGYSPDGLVGDDGLIEIKSRRQKYQFQTIANDEVPSEYMAQLQTALLVSGRKWIEFVSYSAGMPLYIKRVTSDEEYQDKIIEAAVGFEEKINTLIGSYYENSKGLMQTERKDEEGVSLL